MRIRHIYLNCYEKDMLLINTLLYEIVACLVCCFFTSSSMGATSSCGAKRASTTHSYLNLLLQKNSNTETYF